MIYWILIAIAVVVILVLLKFKEFRHKFGFLIVLFLLLFLALSFWSVYSRNKVDLTTFQGVVSAGKVYFSWLDGMFTNTKSITSYAIHQDWGINNSIVGDNPPVNNNSTLNSALNSSVNSTSNITK